MSGDNSGIATGNGKVTITGNVYVGSELSVNPRTAWISAFTSVVWQRNDRASRCARSNVVPCRWCRTPCLPTRKP